MPLTAAQLQVLVTADTLPAQASLGAMNERVATSHAMFGGMISQIGSFVAGQVIFAVLARAVMEVETQIKDAAQKTSDWNDKLVQLNAVLSSTHGVAGFTRDAAIQLADSLSSVTRFNNIAVLDVENLLLTFTALGKDVLPQATEAVLNMATALHEDTKSASIQLGKALQDPILGMTALRRVGVNFSADQKKMVEMWIKHGEKAKAVAFILKEIQTEFGGSARAAGTDLKGQLDILNNQFDIVKETIGNAMIPVLSGLLKALLPVMTAVADGLPHALNVAGDAMGVFFGHMSTLVNASRGDMMPAMADMSKTFNATLGPAIQQVGAWIMNTLMPAIVQLQMWFATKIMPIILQVAGIIMTDFMPTIEMLAGKIMQKLIPPLERIIQDVMPALIPLFRLLGWVFSNVVGPALGGVIDLIGHLLDGIAWVADKLNYFFSNLQKMKDVGGAVLHAIHVPGFAEGGVAQGGLAIVGERGPEIVSLPAGSRVYPNGSTPGGSASGRSAQSQPIILQIDGRTLARLVLPPMVQEIRQHAAIRSQ
jgi:hypothetical protein